ncbi:MAG TPA: hypothetical protein DCZ91_14275 [Lachnospiraceae bacterium]|nr:hypothetical protein [Lachnospiraceae bacterium]
MLSSPHTNFFLFGCLDFPDVPRGSPASGLGCSPCPPLDGRARLGGPLCSSICLFQKEKLPEHFRIYREEKSGAPKTAVPTLVQK